MKHTSYQVPAPRCFGVEFINEVLLVQQVFQVIPRYFCIIVKSLKMLKLQIHIRKHMYILVHQQHPKVMSVLCYIITCIFSS